VTTPAAPTLGQVPGIVSLLPSATEWVCALGLEDRLIAVTFECDAPAGVQEGRAVVVEGLATRDDQGEPLPPGAIDALVREHLAASRPLYTLDDATVRALAPDVVLTQDLCAVCALPSDAVRDALALLGRPPEVVTLDPHTLPDVLDAATRVADACGVPEAGAGLRKRLQERLDDVAAGVRAVAGEGLPRVLVLEWTDPPFAAGHWVPEMLAAAGAVPLLAIPGGRSLAVGWDDVVSVAAEADAVLVAPCGLGLADAHRLALEVLPLLPPAPAVWAVASGEVVTRPGPRVVDGVEALAAVLHPGSALARPDLVARVRAGEPGNS
jgi:iron complex transport system substrate-binding protein